MHYSNKYYQDATKRNGTRNSGHMGYTDLLETFLQNQRHKKLQAFLLDNIHGIYEENDE